MIPYLIPLLCLAIALKLLLGVFFKRDDEKEFQEYEKELHRRHMERFNQDPREHYRSFDK